MTDTITRPDKAVAVTRCNGFLVTLVLGETYESVHCDDWYDAISLYDEGFRGMRGWAITPTADGRPLSAYSAHTIAMMRADR